MINNGEASTSTNNLSIESNNLTITEDESDIWNNTLLQQILDDPFELPVSDNNNSELLRKDNQYFGFDNVAGEYWIYPKKYSIRNYQYNIIKKAIFSNTLVCLPTGLGKTFIAAVVMYNIYRWYPRGKIIFMAPTRPLVAQQINACYNIMGIPKIDTTELTGKISPSNRSQLWQTKRLFFCTPEVVQSDMTQQTNFPFEHVRLIVVDEAHKSKGKYAYAEVIKLLYSKNKFFRVLALSATPGKSLEDVKEIIKNLLISHIEVRSENSIDVCSYVHKKNIQTIVVPLGEKLYEIREEFISILEPYIRNLLENNVISGSTGLLTRNRILMEQKRFIKMSINHRHQNHSQIMSDFGICVSLYHALGLLDSHGILVFLNFFETVNSQYEKYFVQQNKQLQLFLNNLRSEVGTNIFLNINDESSLNKIPSNSNIGFGHPKFNILEKYVLEHLTEHKNSKIMIFCEFRDSCLLIYRLLLQHRPFILPKLIVGQGGSSGIKHVTQKQQIAIMESFRNGSTNTLISTAVAEEGIDVGEVDLIICFDIITKNPTRFLQRIGRTGRQRRGEVIILATEGREHETVKDVLLNKDKINKKIADSNEISRELYTNSPRLVPPNINPICIETYIKINGIDNNSTIVKNDLSTSINNNNKIIDKQLKKSKRIKKKTDTITMNDMRHFFTNKNNFDKELEFFSTESKKLNKSTNYSNRSSSRDNIMNVENILISTSSDIAKQLQYLHHDKNTNGNTRKRKILCDFGIKNLILDEKYLEDVKYSLKKLENELDHYYQEIHKKKIPVVTNFNEDQYSIESQCTVIYPESNYPPSITQSITNEQTILNYFRLTSIDDIFMDSYDDVDISSPKKIINDVNDFYCEKTDKSLMDKKPIECNKKKYDRNELNQTMCTVSQVLDLINANNNNSTKVLDIGTFDEIFNSDDDMFADSIIHQNNNKDEYKVNNNIIESSPERTQEYKIDKIVTQNISNKVTNSVYRVKSPDLFDLFNNTTVYTNSVINSKENSQLNPSTLAANIQENKLNTEEDLPVLSDTKLYIKSIEEDLTRINPETIKAHKSTQSLDSNFFDDSLELTQLNLDTKMSMSPVSSRNILVKEEKSPSMLYKKSTNFSRLKLMQFSNKTAIEQSSSTLTQSRSPYFFSCEQISSPIQPRSKKRLIVESSDNDSKDEILESCTSKLSGNKKITKSKKRRKFCKFLDLEANASGINSSDECDETHSELILDSLIVTDEDDDIGDINVDMQAKYLQSLGEQILRPDIFKIPDKRKYENLSNIYSQPVFDVSNYLEDSFVVNESQPLQNTNLEECPLERAEAILRERSKKRRNKNENVERMAKSIHVKKRRKIICYENSSDDEIEIFRNKQ